MEKTIIKGLVLDYGGVISKAQNSENVENILHILNLDDNDFRRVYESIRENYDSGQFTGEKYWRSILHHYNLEESDYKVNDLIQEDIKSWTQINDVMVRFIKESRPKVRKLAIISNMTKDILAFMNEHFNWLDLFDALVFSCEIGTNKPDRRIYEACLRLLDLSPQECLFVDDSEKNVSGAIKSGMHGLHFKSFSQFRQEINQRYRLSQ